MATIFQKSFAAGEVAPSLYARTDLVKYATGARTMRNMYVGRQGGAYNRPGTVFGTVAKESDYRVRLIPFDLPGDRHFQLEFGHLYVRPLRDWRPIPISAKTIKGITKASSAVIETDEFHGFVIGDVVTFSGVAGMTQINGLTGTITAKFPSLLTVNINSTGFSTYTSGGTVGLVTERNTEFVSPFTEDEIFEMTYQQQTEEMLFAHANHTPRNFKFVTDNTWAFAEASTSPSIATPTSFSVSGAAGTAFYYAVSAVKIDTAEESTPAIYGVDSVGTQVAPRTLIWFPVTGAAYYNVYGGAYSGSYGFIQTVFSPAYIHGGIPAPSATDFPPIVRGMFSADDLGPRPAAVGYYQQRQFYGNMGPPFLPKGLVNVAPTSNPRADAILASRIGSPTYFNTDVPLQADSVMSFRLLNKRPQEIRHFLDVGKLLVLTEQGAWVLKGGADGGLTPSEINPELISSNGSGYVPPVAIENYAVYVQKGKSAILRTLGFEFQIEGYRGDDLTINASHLVDSYQIVSMDFQNSPHPILWVAREDGTLLGLTFLPSQNIIAWHRHDFTNGKVECVLRSGDDIGFVIRRMIDGVLVRCIESFSSREYLDVKHAVFMDSSRSYDGRNPDQSKTMTISGGTSWDDEDEMTITSSVDMFSAEDEGQGLHITGPDGTLLRFTINTQTDATHVNATPNKTVPVGMRNVGLGNWAKALNYMFAIGHLEGQQVSVFADGFVLHSPNNPEYPVATVDGGEVDIGPGDQHYAVIHVGLPIVADIETLNIDDPGGESMLDKAKMPTKVSIWVEGTRGIWAGAVPPDDESEDAVEGLTTRLNEAKIRYEEGYDEPNRLQSRVIDIQIQGQWTNHGRVFIRQVDPLPMSILAIAPGGYIPIGGR